MTRFLAKRFVVRHIFTAHASPEEVFPLLCPVRESEWIPGWSARIDFSESGMAENNCVFTAEVPGRGTTTYIVTRYDKEPFVIEFAIISPGMLVEKVDLVVLKTPDGNCEVSQARTYTSLSPEGIDWAEAFVGGPFQRRWSELANSMNSYLSRR